MFEMNSRFPENKVHSTQLKSWVSSPFPTSLTTTAELHQASDPAKTFKFCQIWLLISMRNKRKTSFSCRRTAQNTIH